MWMAVRFEALMKRTGKISCPTSPDGEGGAVCCLVLNCRNGFHSATPRRCFPGRRRSILLAHGFQSPHRVGMVAPCHALLGRCSVQLRMQIEAAFAGVLWHFDHERVSLRVRNLTDGGDLPGNIDVRLVGPDRE